MEARWVVNNADSARDPTTKSQPRGEHATILDIADRSGLSKSLVSRALRGQYGVSTDAQARVAKAAEELGYVSNAAAQSLRAYRTNTIGVLVRDASAPFYGEMQSALQKRGSALGQRVFITSGALDNNDERRALEDLIALRVDGLIVCSGRLPMREVKRFSGKFPVVVAGRPDVDPAVNSIFGDEDAGAHQLAQHLLLSGHRRIMVLGPPDTVSPILYRRTKVMTAELEAGGAQVLSCSVHSPADVTAELADGIPQQITAVMCANDRYAAALLVVLQNRSRRLAVTGFDGIGELAHELIGLTTWRQPIEAIGISAVNRLMHVISAPQEAIEHTAIQGELHTSRSTQK